MKRYSIIIPCYNSENTILRAIESTTQFFKYSVEIIIIDDGSNDNSYNLISKKYNTVDNIKLIRLDENRGVTHARNLGIDISFSKYMLFLDSDDYYLDGAAEAVEKTIKYNNNIDVFCFSYLINGKKSPDISAQDNKNLNVIFLEKKFTNTNSIITKTSIVKKNKFRVGYDIGEDTDLFFRLMTKYNSKYINIPISYYEYTPKVNVISSHPILDVSIYELPLTVCEKEMVTYLIEKNLNMRKCFSRYFSLSESFKRLGMKGMIFWFIGPNLFHYVWKLKNSVGFK